MQTVTVSWLQSIEALKEVPAEQLQWLIDHSDHYELEEGTFLAKPGDIIRGTHIIIAGRLRLYMQQGGDTRDIAILEAKAISGYLPFSRGKAAGIMTRALEHTE